MSSTDSKTLTEELEPSELGTKEHWDKTYKEELDNYISHGVVGESWFGEDIEIKIIDFLDSNAEISKDSSIADVGCGNGMMLLQLARLGFTNLTGIDYSADAVDLGRRLLDSNDFEFVVFEVLDLLCEKEALSSEKFSVCLDKGTYDAVSLLKAEPTSSQIPREKYLQNIHHMLQKTGLFVLTSCNWTANELCLQTLNYFEFVKTVPTPQFKFGGKIGNLVSIVVLKKI